MGLEIEKVSYNRKWLGSATLFLASMILWGGNDGIKPLHPLFNATTPEAIKHYGYSEETHKVTTEDGYILEMHRVFAKNSSMSIGKPVFIQHGLMCSSFDWVVNPPHQSLSYSLADEGYDVWLGNFRGNSYSLDHVLYSTDQSEFWDFSYDEMGRYDVPAMMDYILNSTGHSRLHYVAHSMGTASYFILMHYNPEYSSKVESMFALGPATTINNLRSSLQYFTFLFYPVETFMSWLGKYQFVPDHFISNMLGYMFCKEGDITQSICEHFVNSIAGYSQQVNKTMYPVYFSSTPAGTSYKTGKHYKQAITAPQFQAYDYSATKNMEVYGQPSPPQYQLSRATAGTYIYYSNNDYFSTVEDIVSLANQLPNVKKVHEVEAEDFSHLDFLWGVNNKELLFDDIIENIKNLDSHKM